MKNGPFKTIIFTLLLSLSSCNNTSNTNNSINTSTNTNITSTTSEVSSEHIISSTHTHKESEVVIENKIEATCLDEGSYDEVIYCLDCKEELSREHKTISALGHDYSDWVTIKEANDIQDGLKQRECSRCHDKQEEIIPTTSKFTFKLNNDKSSYTVDGFNVDKDTYVPYTSSRIYNTSYTKGATSIVIPETFNDLPVTHVELSFALLKDEPNPNIYIGKNVKINGLIISKYLEHIKDNTLFNLLRDHNEIINIYYKGDISDWLKYSPIDAKTNIVFNENLYNLYLFDQNSSSYELVDELSIPEGVEEINKYAFYSLQFSKLICPSTLKTINSWAVSCNNKLKEVVLNEGLLTIKDYAFTYCTNLNSLTLPASITSIANAALNNELLEIKINKGAKGYINSLKYITSLIKIIDDNEDTSYLDDTKYITKNNLANSDIFIYQGFKVVKINDAYKVIKYVMNGEEDENLRLPEKIIYKDNEINEYSVGQYFMKQIAPMDIKFDDILNAYSDINEMRKYYKNADDLFYALYLPKSIKEIDAQAFTSVYFLKDIYFDGSYEQWQNIVKKSESGFVNNFEMARTKVVHVKDENNEYTEMPIYAE